MIDINTLTYIDHDGSRRKVRGCRLPLEHFALEQHQKAISNLTIERDALHQQLEAAQKDAERYRWLRKGLRYTVVVPSPTDKKPNHVMTSMFAPHTEIAYGVSLDTAIDTAIAATKGTTT